MKYKIIIEPAPNADLDCEVCACSPEPDEVVPVYTQIVDNLDIPQLIAYINAGRVAYKQPKIDLTDCSKPKKKKRKG